MLEDENICCKGLIKYRELKGRKGIFVNKCTSHFIQHRGPQVVCIIMMTFFYLI